MSKKKCPVSSKEVQSGISADDSDRLRMTLIRAGVRPSRKFEFLRQRILAYLELQR